MPTRWQRATAFKRPRCFLADTCPEPTRGAILRLLPASSVGAGNRERHALPPQRQEGRARALSYPMKHILLVDGEHDIVLLFREAKESDGDYVARAKGRH